MIPPTSAVMLVGFPMSYPVEERPPSKSGRTAAHFVNPTSMRFSAMTILAAGLAVAPALAAPRVLETVIVEPVAANLQFSGSTHARSEQIDQLQQEARASQASLIEHLSHQNVGATPAVAEIHPLWLVNRIVVTGTPEALRALEGRSDVKSIRKPVPFKIVRPRQVAGKAPAEMEKGATYGLEKLQVPEAWKKFGVSGQGVVVGHLDTGVYSIHPDIEGKVIKFKDFFGSDQTTAFDGGGHGTHTAGTIVGGATSGKAVGVAPNARLIVGRIFNAGGATTDAIILRAMNWVADPDGNPQTADGPRLVSNSWGGETSSQVSGDDLWLASARWAELGILPVFAAGNSGPKGKVGVPGGYPHCLAVGSTNWFSWASYFSSRGPSKWDGVEYTKPDVAAPGSGVYSLKDKGGYTTMDGTSMACPHVAGVAALMYEANPNLKVSQVVDILRGTAKDLGTAGKDNTYGWGLVDAVKAVERAKALAAFTTQD